ncbi:MAG: hypothetical protein BWY78_00060 [Alphaproteobacteria bacterium ADurb.Bin438]|nr:MAG: hypothetical protein BWY78_00060 [Alphaproteobacteria bacterium ADurb.Bin438]
MSDSIRLGNKFQIGKAGEHLVCFDLIKKGFLVSIASETLPYDLLLDTGNKIIKVQVKTTECPKKTNQWRGRSEAYVFNIKRKGANGAKKYLDNEVDLFALVSLDTMQVGYIKNCDMPTTINIRVDNMKGDYHDEKGIINYNKIVKLKGKSIKEIISITGLSKTSIRNILRKGYEPFKTKALYMSDLIRNKEWIMEL